MGSFISLQITIFILIAVGYLVRKLGLVQEQGQKNLNDLVIYIILPCNILKAFLNGNVGGMAGEYSRVLAISIGIQILCVIYGKLAYTKEQERKRKCLQYATICSNAGFLGNPVAEGLYGPQGLVLASIYLIPQRIMMWSAGLPIFSGIKNRRQQIKKVITHPCIIACIAGMGFMLMGWSLPDLLTGAVNALGSCNTAMSMMVIGMILVKLDIKQFWDVTVLKYCIHRLLIIPGVVYLACRLLPVTTMTRDICVILAAMPAGATTSILAEKYHMEPEFATKTVIVSTLLSLPGLIFWMWCLRM